MNLLQEQINKFAVVVYQLLGIQGTTKIGKLKKLIFSL